ncbi:hypothetical protein ACI3PL_22110, partial [Lacticaseibacillus paracasei]
ALANELKDIRKDVNHVDERIQFKLATIEDNIITLQKNLENIIENIKNSKDNDKLNTINKNKLVTILVTIISVLFISSNDKTQELLTKLLM